MAVAEVQGRQGVKAEKVDTVPNPAQAMVTEALAGKMMAPMAAEAAGAAMAAEAAMVAVVQVAPALGFCQEATPIRFCSTSAMIWLLQATGVPRTAMRVRLDYATMCTLPDCLESIEHKEGHSIPQCEMQPATHALDTSPVV